jgi:hypothetical protein
MLSIGKPAEFGPNGMAVRGQCNPDSPGWQLIWFEKGRDPETIWQGAYRTCRRLQAGCLEAGAVEEAKILIDALLAVPAESQPTDIFPSPSPIGRHGQEERAGEDAISLTRKKKRKKRY